MNIAICVATPFQAMNAINLACNTFEQSDRKVLLYRNFSDLSNDILLGIKKYSIFDKIYEYDLISKDNKLVYLFNDFVQAVFPEIFVKWIIKDCITLKEEAFNYITFTSGTELEVALTRIFPKAKTIAYDDGLGSYVGDIIHDHKLYWIWKILGRKTSNIWPDCLYVNNVEFCDSTLTKNKKELLSLNKCTNQYKHMICDIFNVSQNTLYSERPIVYLSQPLDEVKRYVNGYEDKIENVLKQFNQYGIYRKHPRDNHITKLNYKIDSSRCIWELICANQITEENILVSVCSTTQIIPKIMYNKEPWIIFTYKLCGIEEGYIFKTRFNPIIQKIKDKYCDKSKILEPKSFKELEKMIYTILSYKKG